MTTTRTARLEQEIKRLRTELAIANYDRVKRQGGSHLKICDAGDSYMRLPSRNSKTQQMYIHHLEEQIRETRMKYQQQIGEVKIKASELEEKLQKVYQDMSCITEKAKLVDRMQNNIEMLKSKLERRDLTIARFSEQYSKFLTMVQKFQTKSYDGNFSEMQKQPQEMQEKHLTRTIKRKKPKVLNNSIENMIENHTESNSEPEIIDNFMFLGEALKQKLQRNWTLTPTK